MDAGGRATHGAVAEYTESTEERQRKSKHKGFDLLCALCVLCGSRFSLFGSGLAGSGGIR